ncbi:MAG: restriction endonuclease subunit S [Firmicutes bacterium]|nr:restriction endonuclease subunit S [Bacillota bacterium]
MNQAIKNRIAEIKAGKVPTGYVEAGKRFIPSEWKVVRLRDLFDRLNRRNTTGNDNVLTLSAQHGLIKQNDFFNKEVASKNKDNYVLLKKGEFAYNKSYSGSYYFGAIKILERYDEGIVSPLYICFSAKEGVNKEFYKQYFAAKLFNFEILRIAQEGARNHGLLNLAIDDFFNIKIIEPPTEEQLEIAKVLVKWDEAIALQKKVIDRLERQKKAYLEKFLTQGENAEKLEKHIVQKRVRNKIGSKNVLSVSNKFGFTSQREQFGKIVASKELSNYKIVTKGDIAFNPSRINIGSIALYLGEEVGIVSPMYSIFSCKETLDPYVLLLILKTRKAKHKIHSSLAGSVRDTLSINALENIELTIPKKEVQKKIKEFFVSLDDLIELNNKKLEALKLQKQSLMQLLLTGIVRVKGGTK